MRAYDWHVVPSTHKAGRKKTLEQLAAFEEHYKMKWHYDTEEEMMDIFKKADVKVCLHPRAESPSLEGFREGFDYICGIRQKYPDIIFALSIGEIPGVEPGSDIAIAEIDKYRKKVPLFVSVSGTLMYNRPLNDKSIYPLYEWCSGNNVPVILYTGSTGGGSGLPGGDGLYLWYDHPKYVDMIARDFPKLNIIVSRPAWPWQDEMLAVVEHKANILGNELHGWAPKYFTAGLKQRMNSIMQNKFMFGSDYPLFTYERLFKDWEDYGLKPEVLEKVLIKNTQRILEQLGMKP